MKATRKHESWHVGDPIRSTDTLGICKRWTDGEETGEETIAEVLPGCPPAVMLAQAKLIAAAPELLAALREMCGALEDSNSGAYQTLADARAAIEKATR